MGPVKKRFAGAKIRHYESIDWDDPLKSAAPGTAPPKALVEQAKKAGAKRKKIVEGEGGFFMNRSVLTPGFRVPPHRHNHSELLVVIRGGCEFDHELGSLGPDDTIVIEANTIYGFTCGEEGMEFLTIRSGEADTAVTE